MTTHRDEDIRWSLMVARRCGRRLGYDRLPTSSHDLDQVADLVLRLVPQEKQALNVLGIHDFITTARVAVQQLTIFDAV